MNDMKNENLWKGIQPLTSLITTLPHSLVELCVDNISNLVELPSEFQNFTQLLVLEVTSCINLETISNGINIPSLRILSLEGCSRLRTFPNLSTNISNLYLSRTGIEEVPWWIENFSNLIELDMQGCDKLQCVSLHICKLKYLGKVDFLNCKALTTARWNDCSSVMEMATDDIHSKFKDKASSSSSFPDNFINFFQDLEPSYYHNYKRIRLSGEKVLSYFSHQTTGMYLTNIPLLQTSLSQPYLRFKTCVVVESSDFDIKVSCRFKDRLGNHFDSHSRPCLQYHNDKEGYQLVIFECCFPLNEENASLAEVNYDHVDIQLHLNSTFEVKEWGIRLSDDFASPEICLGNDNNLPDVCEANDNNLVNETEQSEESVNNNEETERSNKPIKSSEEDQDCSSPQNQFGNQNTCPHVREADKENLVNETENNEECVETVVKRHRETGSADYEEDNSRNLKYIKIHDVFSLSPT